MKIVVEYGVLKMRKVTILDDQTFDVAVKVKDGFLIITFEPTEVKQDDV